MSWPKALVHDTRLHWASTSDSMERVLQTSIGGIPQEQAEDKESAIACAKQNMETTKLMVTDVKQHASAFRETGLQLLAKQYAAEHNINKAMALKQLLCKEHLAQIYRKLGYHISGKYYDPLK